VVGFAEFGPGGSTTPSIDSDRFRRVIRSRIAAECHAVEDGRPRNHTRRFVDGVWPPTFADATPNSPLGFEQTREGNNRILCNGSRGSVTVVIGGFDAYYRNN